MWSTLACLIVCMTGTAALLGWIDPSHSLFMSATSLEDLQALARSAVTDGVEPRGAWWREVEIATTPVELESPLAASTNASTAHFHVDDAGRVTQNVLWTQQGAIPNEPHTIRIQLDQSGPELSQEQKVAIDGLLQGMNGMTQNNRSRPLPFHFVNLSR